MAVAFVYYKCGARWRILLGRQYVLDWDRSDGYLALNPTRSEKGQPMIMRLVPVAAVALFALASESAQCAIITVTVVGNGTVTASPSFGSFPGSVTYPDNIQVQFFPTAQPFSGTAEANGPYLIHVGDSLLLDATGSSVQGSVFAGWTGAGTGTGSLILTTTTNLSVGAHFHGDSISQYQWTIGTLSFVSTTPTTTVPWSSLNSLALGTNIPVSLTIQTLLGGGMRYTDESTLRVEAVSTPEPASLAIWGLGVLGCAMAGYRRRQSRSHASGDN